MRLKLLFIPALIAVATLGLWGQQPQLVTTPYGEFSINATVTNEKYSGHKLKGTITNNTSKDWMGLEFSVVYFDASGNKVDTIGGETLRIAELKKGASFSIGYGYGQTIVGRHLGSDTPIARCEASFKDGTIPAAYSFALLKKSLSKTGKPTFSESTELAYSDDLADFSFSVSKRQFSFVLKNKTDEPMDIDWNKVSFVDIGGESHKVMHEGVKYIARNESLAPTTVPPSAKLQDIVFPADYVYYSEGEYGGWRELALFPDGEKALALKGQTFTIFMPVRVNGAVKNYSFKFKISDVTL